MKKIIAKIRFWKQNKNKNTVGNLKDMPPPPEETIPEDELPLHEGHPI